MKMNMNMNMNMNTSTSLSSSMSMNMNMNMNMNTGGHFLIRLGSQNEWDGQRDRGPEDGTIVKGL
jgi:hypothetical protein